MRSHPSDEDTAPPHHCHRRERGGEGGPVTEAQRYDMLIGGIHQW